jgi:hypothetical protein
MPCKWSVVVAEMRHEEQIFPSSSRLRLDEHSRNVRDFELIIVTFWSSQRDNMPKINLEHGHRLLT